MKFWRDFNVFFQAPLVAYSCVNFGEQQCQKGKAYKTHF